MTFQKRFDHLHFKNAFMDLKKIWNLRLSGHFFTKFYDSIIYFNLSKKNAKSPCLYVCIFVATEWLFLGPFLALDCYPDRLLGIEKTLQQGNSFMQKESVIMYIRMFSKSIYKVHQTMMQNSSQ